MGGGCGGGGPGGLVRLEVRPQVRGDEGVCLSDDLRHGFRSAHGGIVLELLEVAVQAVHVLGVFDRVDHHGFD